MTDTHNTRVLFVDHDTQDHETNKNLLLSYSYKVTAVKLASTASAILWSRKEQFDLVLANMMSPDDISGFQLLQDAIQMDLRVILMSNNDDPLTNMRALAQGAYLCVKKSVAMHIMKYLWVHIARLKADTIEPRAIQNESDENQNKTPYCVVEGKRSSKRVNSLKTSKHDCVKFKKKVSTRWTKELHEKFVDAVKQLGEGRCYPNEILQLMNEPTVTRMQVASHLQICRNTLWVPPVEKMANSATPPLNNYKAPRSKALKIGAMPCLVTNFEPRDHGIINQEGVTFAPSIGDIFLEDYNNNTNGSFEYGIINQQGVTFAPSIGDVFLDDYKNNNNGSFDHEVFDHQPELVLDHNGINPFSQYNETGFGMGVLPTQTYSMDELFMHGSSSQDAVAPAVNNIPAMTTSDILEDHFEISNFDTLVEELRAFEKEVGLESISSQNYQKIITATDQWRQEQEVAKSAVNDQGWLF